MSQALTLARSSFVALLAEGVDRNMTNAQMEEAAELSPSSRRAWIEIVLLNDEVQAAVSPSSRRAWIEILCRTR